MAGTSSTRRAVVLGLKIAVSVGLLAILATRIDLRELGERIVGADRGILLLGGAIFLASNVVGALQWRTLLRACGVHVSLARVFAYYFQGLFFGLFLPASVGADVSRVYDTTKHSGDFGGSVAATIMDRIVGFYSIGTMAIVALLVGRDDLPPAAILVPILGFAVVNVVVFLALVSRTINAVLVRLMARLPGRSGRMAVGIVELLHALGRRPGLLAWVFGLSLIVQVSRIFVHYHVSLALGIVLEPRVFFVIVPVLAVLVALPISFGGIGVRESAAVELFGHVGLSPADAVGMQLTTFLLAIVVNLPGWMIFVLRQLRARREPAASDATGLDAGGHTPHGRIR
jgi:uncharacterized protein (TIRG00374 family)